MNRGAPKSVRRRFFVALGHAVHLTWPVLSAILAIQVALGLLVGFMSRVAAFGIITNMVVAILTVHGQVGLFMNWSGDQKGEGFEFHLLAIALGLAVLVKGAGAFSIFIISAG